jgi:hypothetical protein
LFFGWLGTLFLLVLGFVSWSGHCPTVGLRRGEKTEGVVEEQELSGIRFPIISTLAHNDVIGNRNVVIEEVAAQTEASFVEKRSGKPWTKETRQIHEKHETTNKEKA